MCILTSIRINFFASSGRGFGHASRSRALGDFLEKNFGEKICFGELAFNLNSKFHSASCGHKLHDLEIVDSPYSEDDLLQWFSANGAKTVSFDHRGKFLTDLTITTDAVANFTRGRKYLVGLEYAIIRDELRFSALDSRFREEYSLIVIGGEDASGLTPKVVTQLSNRFGEVKIAVGPWNKNKIRGIPTSSLSSDQILFPTLLKGARRAFSSGGTTLLELMHNGIPTYVIPQNQPELYMARSLQQRGMILGIGVPKTPLANSAELASSRRSKAAVDGMGLERIIKELEKLV